MTSLIEVLILYGLDGIDQAGTILCDRDIFCEILLSLPIKL